MSRSISEREDGRENEEAAMTELAEQGISIIMISSEMEELLGMSDRIIVLHEGALSGELSKEESSQTAVLELASAIN